MMISVIVPVYNGEKHIEGALQSLLEIEKPFATEYIVVDDGSTDKTAVLISKFKDIKYVYQKNKGPASARNHGARLAKGDILFFTDADCRPQKDWTKKMLTVLTEDKVAVVSGTYGIVNKNSRLARCIQNEITYRHQKLMPKYPKSFGSYNFAIRKKTFDLLGGFNITYRIASGEDNDLSYRLLKAGQTICFVKDAVVDHYHPEKTLSYLKDQFRHGYWRAKMYLDFPEMSKGDDYTFWKDMIEVPVTGLILLSFICSFLQLQFAAKIFIWLTFLLTIFEVIWAWILTRNVLDSLYFGVITCLRAFARTSGFLKGLAYFIILKKRT